MTKTSKYLMVILLATFLGWIAGQLPEDSHWLRILIPMALGIVVGCTF